MDTTSSPTSLLGHLASSVPHLPVDEARYVPQICESYLEASGGCPRDLLRLVSHAVLMRGELPLAANDIDLALHDQVSQFERVLQGRPFLPGLHHIEQTGSFPTGFDDSDKQWLLHELIVVEYNGETWYDVHPFARQTRAYREATPPAGS